MEIVNFFEKLAGKWFSQRTTHYLTTPQSKAGQSNLLIEFLPHTDPDAIKLCEALSQDASQIACALRINHDSRMDGDTQNTQSTSLMVALHPNDQGRGVLLQQGAIQAAGEYLLEDEVLSLNTTVDQTHTEERLWFVNPNLRMRTSTITQDGEVQLATFCSEIRMGLAQPPQN